MIVDEMESKMTDRFKILLEQLQLSPSGFADKIGIQRSSVSHIFSGRNKPSIDFLEKILNVYPDIDVNWLITGRVSLPRQASKSKPDPETDLFQELNVTGPKELETEQDKEKEIEENIKLSVFANEEPVDKIIFVYRNGTFRMLQPTDK
jgi:transcriptional regulator with XRE-family HTH domain